MKKKSYQLFSLLRAVNTWEPHEDESNIKNKVSIEAVTLSLSAGKFFNEVELNYQKT